MMFSVRVTSSLLLPWLVARTAGSQFTFNNMVEDSTHTHERLAYRMYATAGVTAPRANLAKVALHVKGKTPHYVSYLNLEGYNDKRFLEESFPGGSNGTLWDLHDPPVFGWEQGVGNFLCKQGCAGGPLDTKGQYGMYSSADNARLEDMLSKAKSPEQFFTEMDKDQFFRLMSLDRILGYWDGPCIKSRGSSQDRSNNFWIWLDGSTNKFRVLPWGTDQTFDRGWQSADAYGCTPMKACMSSSACRSDCVRECG